MNRPRGTSCDPPVASRSFQTNANYSRHLQYSKFIECVHGEDNGDIDIPREVRLPSKGISSNINDIIKKTECKGSKSKDNKVPDSTVGGLMDTSVVCMKTSDRIRKKPHGKKKFKEDDGDMVILFADHTENTTTTIDSLIRSDGESTGLMDMSINCIKPGDRIRKKAHGKKKLKKDDEDMVRLLADRTEDTTTTIESLIHTNGESLAASALSDACNAPRQQRGDTTVPHQDHISWPVAPQSFTQHPIHAAEAAPSSPALSSVQKARTTRTKEQKFPKLTSRMSMPPLSIQQEQVKFDPSSDFPTSVMKCVPNNDTSDNIHIPHEISFPSKCISRNANNKKRFKRTKSKEESRNAELLDSTVDDFIDDSISSLESCDRIRKKRRDRKK